VPIAARQAVGYSCWQPDRLTRSRRRGQTASETISCRQSTVLFVIRQSSSFRHSDFVIRPFSTSGPLLGLTNNVKFGTLCSIKARSACLPVPAYRVLLACPELCRVGDSERRGPARSSGKKVTRQRRRHSLGLPANGSIFENLNPAHSPKRSFAGRLTCAQHHRKAPRSLPAVAGRPVFPAHSAVPVPAEGIGIRRRGPKD
jgi:hypothetical protein